MVRILSDTYSFSEVEVHLAFASNDRPNSPVLMKLAFLAAVPVVVVPAWRLASEVR